MATTFSDTVGAGTTLSSDKLTVTCNGSSNGYAKSTTAKTSGKYCFEFTVGAAGASPPGSMVGIVDAGATIDSTYSYNTNNCILCWQYNGDLFSNGGTETSWYSSIAVAMMVAIDVDARTIKVKKQGGDWSTLKVWPSGWSGSGVCAFVADGRYLNFTGTVNFGATSFVNTMPDGYSAWNSSSTASATTWNPSDNVGFTLSNSNKTANNPSGAETSYVRAIGAARSSGKYYFEMTTTDASANTCIGVAVPGTTITWATYANMTCLGVSSGTCYGYNGTGQLASWCTARVAGTYGFAVDLDAKTIKVRQGTGAWSTAISISHLSSVLPAVAYAPADDTITLNCGDSAFVGTVPDGYSAWDAVVADDQSVI